MNSSKESSRRIVRKDCETWPAAEREAWLALFDPDDDECLGRWAARRLTPWVRESQYACARVYSRYLDCMRRCGQPDYVTPQGLAHFIRDVERQRIAIRTIAGYVKNLRSVMILLYPDRAGEFDWLKSTFRNIVRLAERQPKRKSHDKRCYSARDLFRAGAEMIIEAQAADQVDWTVIQEMRDGLWLLIGSLCPERLKALESIEISQVDFERRLIKFPADKMKTKEESYRIFPEVVVGAIELWLDCRRRYEPHHGRLWIANGGRAVRSGTMYAAMRKATKDRLGVAVTPQRLRDAAATFVVEELPESARLASLVLRHKSEAMTRNYTETAKQLVASRRVADHLKAAEDEVARRLRVSHPRSPVGRTRRRKKCQKRRLTRVENDQPARGCGGSGESKA